MPFEMVKELLTAAKSTLLFDDTVLDIKPPVYVIGDLHGNFHVCFPHIL